MGKRIKLIILFCIITVSCCGCVRKEEVRYPWCYVNNITDAEVSNNKLVCMQDDVIYYYDSNAIYKYEEETEFIKETDTVVASIIKVSHGLYYAQKESDGYRIYKYDLNNKKTTEVIRVDEILKMFSHGEDIFVCGRDCSASGCVWVIQDDGVTYVNELVRWCETDLYEWEDYTIDVIDDSIKGYIGEIYAEDGWRYFQGNPAYIEGADVKISVDDYKITFDGEEKDFSGILEKEKDGCATTMEFVCVEGGKMYLLYQYGWGASSYYINPSYYYYIRDAIYAIDLKTREMELIYDTEDKTKQIGGFSVKKNEMYLVKLDGVYRCDMQGNNEVKIVDGFYETLVFEACNDLLFIYDASDLQEYKLLLID